jgi:long-chain acyl-CoA synthetase
LQRRTIKVQHGAFGLARSDYVAGMTLDAAFKDIASQHPQKTALFWGEEEFSFGQLQGQALCVGVELNAQFGIQKGDRVALWLKNCPQFVTALFGIWNAGGVAVPINNFLKPAEVSYILGDSDIDVIITDESMADNVAKLQSDRPSLRVFTVETFPASVAGFFASTARKDSDLAVVIYTSGTTGRPKGAMLSHANLMHNVNSCAKVLELVGDDRIVVLLPMFHSFMMTVGILLPLLVGGSMVLVKSVHPPKNIVQEILRHRATILPAVPQFFRMLTHGGMPADMPLRLCISGGAPLPAEILREFTAKFPIPLLEGYGLSEASPVVSFNPIRGPWKAGSIGVPVHDVEVSIQNELGEILPPNTTGEVCVRGGNVMQGYWNQPEETAAVLRNGWLLTGDVGHVDTDGYFYITDRKKDMLLVNGINVYPREIEEALYKFPGVKEAAVIGVPDVRKGEQPVAFVAANDGMALDTSAILLWLRERLADYKTPKRIVQLPSLPRNATGKILKTALREQISELT